MNDQEIRNIAVKFRAVIEEAHRDGRFDDEIAFKNFPRGCCGDTCYLLGEYMRRKSIPTLYVSTERGDWTHA